MTEQEERQWLFDVSLKNIRAQGKASMAKGVGCAYRGGESGELRCAAAPFVIDYDPSFEEKPFSHIVEKYPDAVDPRAGEHHGFVEQLQIIHDDTACATKDDEDFLKIYEQRMKSFAEREGLEYKEPLGN